MQYLPTNFKSCTLILLNKIKVLMIIQLKVKKLNLSLGFFKKNCNLNATDNNVAALPYYFVDFAATAIKTINLLPTIIFPNPRYFSCTATDKFTSASLYNRGLTLWQ